MKLAQVLVTVAMVAALSCTIGMATDNKNESTSTSSWADSSLEGKSVDISPWAYLWRADREVQATPEACFIPRRLDRQDKVYRTLFNDVPEKDRKSIYYEAPELLALLLPKPKGALLAGLLWTGRLENCQVELHWPADVWEIPSPESVEVRSFPTDFGWFGWSKDEVLRGPQVSADGRTWTYQRSSSEKLPVYAHTDGKWSFWSGSATELIAIFCDRNWAGAKPIVPTIGVTGPSLGAWRRLDVQIEWGFQSQKTESFDGHLESYIAVIGPIRPLPADKGTTVTAGHKWESRAVSGHRRGIVVPLLYSPGGQPALDSRVTVWTKQSGFTFRVRDLENGPILIPEHGVFISKVGSGQTAREFIKELATRNLKGVRQMTRERPEAVSWDELMQEVRLRTCPTGTPVPPFPKVGDPPMQVQLSDARWTDAWRAAANQLMGKHMWGGLAVEVGRVAHEMDLVGLHGQADHVYQHFLESPGVKSDGDYTDGKGSLEWATSMRHDMGYSHDGTHASTGRLLFAMAERYFLTGDREWFERNRARLQAAADWIIRQRTLYMKDTPQRQDLLVAGLMPPCMLGDYALPSCDWRWYYPDDALDLQGLQRFADALTDFDPKAGERYRDAAEAFRKDLRRTVDREAALSPVRLGCDGVYRSFIPQVPYVRGELLGLEYGSIQRPQGDLLVGALPLAEPYGVLDANDPRMVGTMNAMEEIGSQPKVRDHLLSGKVAETMDVMAAIRESVSSGQPVDQRLFWNCFGGSMPKASFNANTYLLQDDVPNFLRFWENAYANLVGADGKMWEWGHMGQFTKCTDPDNGTAGWFMENFRNLLVMEAGQSLWIARATPRPWLGQGKRISVRNAPTCFGNLAYEIVSDVDNGKITTTIEIPSRSPAEAVILRLRHPRAVRLKRVTVNSRPWSKFDPEKETITLTGLTGTVSVVAGY